MKYLLILLFFPATTISQEKLLPVDRIEIDSNGNPVIIHKVAPLPRTVCPAYIYHKRDWVVYQHGSDSCIYIDYANRINNYILSRFKGQKIPDIWVELVDSGYNMGYHSNRHVWKKGLHIQVPRTGDQSDQLERLVDFAIRNIRMLKDMEKAIRDFDEDMEPECANISQDLIEQILQWDYRKR